MFLQLLIRLSRDPYHRNVSNLIAVRGEFQHFPQCFGSGEVKVSRSSKRIRMADDSSKRVGVFSHAVCAQDIWSL